jgi:23S rRNA maturation-related 3'-5' exoribonuclease YhaM
MISNQAVNTRQAAASAENEEMNRTTPARVVQVSPSKPSYQETPAARINRTRHALRRLRANRSAEPASRSHRTHRVRAQT